MCSILLLSPNLPCRLSKGEFRLLASVVFLAQLDLFVVAESLVKLVEVLAISTTFSLVDNKSASSKLSKRNMAALT